MNIESINQLEGEKQAFFFIPDISGFTKFIHDTNLKDSKNLIHELLEVILDSNVLNLKVAEILGDAIVFYSIGTPPSITKLESQTKKTFTDFQRALTRLEEHHSLSKELHNLTLKIVVHYGEVATTEIKGITKLIGSDLILAYRMLKNNIKEHEYLLMTEQYLATQNKETVDKSFSWSTIKDNKIKYDFFGVIPYKYVPLTNLREDIRNIV